MSVLIDRLNAQIKHGPKPGVDSVILDLSLAKEILADLQKKERIIGQMAWHRDGVGPDVPVLQARYDVLRQRVEYLDKVAKGVSLMPFTLQRTIEFLGGIRD